ncbi:2,4-dienoyl-CoA reductase-like NADH-dependent reductase (Old Yellow Enzyme family) [Orenia metallireducens]|jgi:2,4-dienoyl-CoA reductase-like NADH-dependent reductase (Old Yellow Enzyme family)|uniref:2,4-dienoyl-CoA reductase n=1 Tax=Orenia metallireducens TaxID=1413210 RepID=A0A285GAG0_9FIRM|nr:oxidoreductase [Orenia metallireducens]PRX28284.1 2,4-dienoyl-CoA reductase-like NADH-dependent reductase (Old Yellow Enzyme family) [Orenia metallireducens]SNY19516.1 2,4-dienoyl-CoA reductase [Orenia metallireducens]
MSKGYRFNYSSLEELREDIEKFNLDLPISKEIDILKNRVVLDKGSIIPNSLVVHPMEGADANSDGTPSELTKRRYKRFATGGAGLIWLEAIAVNESGRANSKQLFMNEENIDSFIQLIDLIRREAHQKYSADFNPYLVAQLTHSGRFGDNKNIIFEDEILDPVSSGENDFQIMSDQQLEELKKDYVNSAKLAKKAGFDAVDIKACHRYLLSEMLAAHTRDGKYGGDYESRTRFLKEVIREVKAEVDIDLAIRLNIYDAIPYPYGWATDKNGEMDLSEPKRLVKELEEMGVKLFNITASTPYLKPYVNRPYDQGKPKPPEHPLQGVYRLLYLTKVIQQELKDGVVVGTGFTWLRQFAPNIAAGMIKEGWTTLVGFGRQAFAYPDFAYDILYNNGLDPQKVCISCSKCAELKAAKMNSGCVIRDQEIYLAIYRKLMIENLDGLAK